MPTLYWGPWLAKIRRGGPVAEIICVKNVRALVVCGFLIK